MAEDTNKDTTPTPSAPSAPAVPPQNAPAQVPPAPNVTAAPAASDVATGAPTDAPGHTNVTDSFGVGSDEPGADEKARTDPSATYYAWSNFPTRNTDGTQGKTFKPGDRISQSDLPGVSDDEWQTLINQGAVRQQPWPKSAVSSPAEHFKGLMQRGSSGQLTQGEVQELTSSGLIRVS